MLFLTKTVLFVWEAHLLSHGKRREPSASIVSVFRSATCGPDKHVSSVSPSECLAQLLPAMAHCLGTVRGLRTQINAGRRGHNAPQQTTSDLVQTKWQPEWRRWDSCRVTSACTFRGPFWTQSEWAEKSAAWGRKPWAGRPIPTMAPKREWRTRLTQGCCGCDSKTWHKGHGSGSRRKNRQGRETHHYPSWNVISKD